MLFDCRHFKDRGERGTTMRSLVIAMLVAAVHATTYSYIISVEPSSDAASSVAASIVDSLKSTVTNLGGYITHEYTLIKGFSAELDDCNIPGLQALVKQVEAKTGYLVHLEKDSEVHTFARHEH